MSLDFHLSVGEVAFIFPRREAELNCFSTVGSRRFQPERKLPLPSPHNENHYERANIVRAIKQVH